MTTSFHFTFHSSHFTFAGASAINHGELKTENVLKTENGKLKIEMRSV